MMRRACALGAKASTSNLNVLGRVSGTEILICSAESVFIPLTECIKSCNEIT